MTDLKDQILQKIKTKEVVMRPRLYFTLQIVMVIAVALGVFLISTFIINFISFGVRRSGDLDMFMEFFPWVLLVLDIVFVGVLLWLIRHFRFGTRVPVLYLFGGLLLGILVLGATIDRFTSVNERLLERADENHLPPPFGNLYRDVHRHEHHPPMPHMQELP
jgi:hypothetical protein